MSATVNTTARRRLNGREIWILRHLRRAAAEAFAVRLNRMQRHVAAPMWRGGLVNAWYRQAPSLTPSLQGPYFNLSAAGARLAVKFTRPRGSAVQSVRG